MIVGLFDSHAAEVARNNAIDAVSTANGQWIEEAVEALRQIAMQQDTLTSDDLARRVALPQEGRAAGGAFSLAKKRGIIEKTDRFRNSARVSKHRSPIRIWRSLLRPHTAEAIG